MNLIGKTPLVEHFYPNVLETHITSHITKTVTLDFSVIPLYEEISFKIT